MIDAEYISFALHLNSRIAIFENGTVVASPKHDDNDMTKLAMYLIERFGEFKPELFLHVAVKKHDCERNCGFAGYEVYYPNVPEKYKRKIYSIVLDEDAGVDENQNIIQRNDQSFYAGIRGLRLRHKDWETRNIIYTG